MLRTFRSEKMIERVKKEGKEALLNDEMLTLIGKLDGKQGDDYNWQSVVKGDEVVWIEGCEEHRGCYVALCDCD